jgi:hypothetical protein
MDTTIACPDIIEPHDQFKRGGVFKNHAVTEHIVHDVTPWDNPLKRLSHGSAQSSLMNRSVGHCCAAEIRIDKVGSLNLRIQKRRPLKISAGEIACFDTRSDQAGTRKIGARHTY